jgi:homocysteine S-methyltransferase
MAMPDGAMKNGDDLRAFFRAARSSGAAAALLNCIPCEGVDLALDAARDSGLPFGAYAHMGDVDPAAGWPATPPLAPDEYAVRAARWLARGATILGGCCGTTPDHIAALARISPERGDPCCLSGGMK